MRGGNARPPRRLLPRARRVGSGRDSTALSLNVADTGRGALRSRRIFDNVRGALEWFRSNGMADKELADHLRRRLVYVHVRGSSVEVAHWLESLVARAIQLEPAQRVDAMHSLAQLRDSSVVGATPRASPSQHVDLARAIDDRSREEWLCGDSRTSGARETRRGAAASPRVRTSGARASGAGEVAWIQTEPRPFRSLHGDLEEGAGRGLRESVFLFERFRSRVAGGPTRSTAWASPSSSWGRPTPPAETLRTAFAARMPSARSRISRAA